MGRICGFIGFDGTALPKEALEKFLRNSCRPNISCAGTGNVYTKDGINLASEETGSFHRSKDDSYVCLVDGCFSHYPRMIDKFRTRGFDLLKCDPAEAMLSYYIYEGPDSLKLLRGSYVFAVWNMSDHTLTLGRDPYGTKRIYYTKIGTGLFFSSDLTGLVRMPMVPQEISMSGLLEYFTFGFINPPYTIYENIYALNAGEYLILKNDELYLEYFHPPVPEQWEFTDVEGKSEEQLLDRFDRLLVDSVKCCLPPGDTVASYLSGGLDTGLLVSVLKKHGGKKVATYTLGSTDAACDEVPSAKQASEYLNISDHYCYYVTLNDFFEALELLPDIFGQPIADISAVPNFVITREVSKRYKSVLTGDGPDGLFGNWDLRPWYYYYHYAPRFFRTPFSHLVDYIDRKLGLGLSTPNRHISELLSQPDFAWVFHKKLKSSELENLFDRSIDADQFPIHNFLRNNKDIPLYERLRLAFNHYFVVNGVLQKSCCIHNAFHVRQISPYYDHDLVEFIQKLPTKYKIKGYGYGKYLHKKLLAMYLPDTIWKKRKQGFIINLREFEEQDIKKYTDHYLSRKRLQESGLLNVEFAQRCIDQFYNGNDRMGPVMYTFLIFELWRERFNM